MEFYTYVLRSKKDDKFYIGATKDLSRRLVEHENGKVVSTKGRRPLELVYYEVFPERKAASEREQYFKSGSGREVLKNIIDG